MGNAGVDGMNATAAFPCLRGLSPVETALCEGLSAIHRRGNGLFPRRPIRSACRAGRRRGSRRLVFRRERGAAKNLR
jgi:hypothetical protein